MIVLVESLLNIYLNKTRGEVLDTFLMDCFRCFIWNWSNRKELHGRFTSWIINTEEVLSLLKKCLWKKKRHHHYFIKYRYRCSIFRNFDQKRIILIKNVIIKNINTSFRVPPLGSRGPGSHFHNMPKIYGRK